MGMGDLYIAYPGEKHGTGPVSNPENHHLWVGLKLDRLGSSAVRLAAELRRSRGAVSHWLPEVEPVLRGLVAQVVANHPQRRQAVLAYLELVHHLGVAAASRRGAPRVRADRPARFASRSSGRSPTWSSSSTGGCPCAISPRWRRPGACRIFCAQFRREVGVSPAAYHLQLRLDAARLTLRQPGFDVTKTAQLHGFSSSQHFSTLFRRAYNLTPRAWRQAADSKPPAALRRRAVA